MAGARPAALPRGAVSACRRLAASRAGRAEVGWDLVREAADHGPGSLTWRERYALSVLASAADDATRECPPGIEDTPGIVARLRLGRSERYAVIRSLCDKGALLHAERGRNGVAAVYLIAPLTRGAIRGGAAGAVDNPGKGPGFPDASGGLKGPGTAAEGSGNGGEGSGFHSAKGPGNPDPPEDGTVFFEDHQEDKTDQSIAHARAREAFRAAVPGVTDQEIDETIRILKTRYRVQKIERYIRRLAKNGDLTRTVKVLGLLEQRVGAPAVAQFAEDLTPASEYEKRKDPVLKPLFFRPKGAGRPTKKDRRKMGNIGEMF